MILDTNIIFEMMRPNPNASVIAWLNQQDAADLFVTAITIGEVFYGLEALPPGRRRQRLVAAFERLIREAFDTRLLILDETAARRWPTIAENRAAEICTDCPQPLEYEFATDCGQPAGGNFGCRVNKGAPYSCALATVTSIANPQNNAAITSASEPTNVPSKIE